MSALRFLIALLPLAARSSLECEKVEESPMMLAEIFTAHFGELEAVYVYKARHFDTNTFILASKHPKEAIPPQKFFYSVGHQLGTAESEANFRWRADVLSKLSDASDFPYKAYCFSDGAVGQLVLTVDRPLSSAAHSLGELAPKAFYAHLAGIAQAFRSHWVGEAAFTELSINSVFFAPDEPGLAFLFNVQNLFPANGPAYTLPNTFKGVQSRGADKKTVSSAIKVELVQTPASKELHTFVLVRLLKVCIMRYLTSYDPTYEEYIPALNALSQKVYKVERGFQSPTGAITGLGNIVKMITDGLKELDEVKEKGPEKPSRAVTRVPSPLKGKPPGARSRSRDRLKNTTPVASQKSEKSERPPSKTLHRNLKIGQTSPSPVRKEIDSESQKHEKSRSYSREKVKPARESSRDKPKIEKASSKDRTNSRNSSVEKKVTFEEESPKIDKAVKNDHVSRKPPSGSEAKRK